MTRPSPEASEDPVAELQQASESKKVPLSVFGALAFVIFATWCNVCGWLLSALRALDAAGYAAGLLLLLGLTGLILKLGRYEGPGLRALTRWRHRALHPLPAFWLLAFLLSFIGGMAFEPRNYDFLTYRLSRILHWWAEGRWHWITTNNDRMNISGPGFEWVLTPFVILTHSARAAALINVLSFALMPGLLFRLLTIFQVPPRAAYQWMWLFPGGYCFVTQAGSAGNDAFAVTYLLAGIVFAFEAGRTRSSLWLYASILSAALLTGVKASNLPLVAPILVSWWPVRALLFRRVVLLAFVVTMAALSSFTPVAIANQLFSGQWAGDTGGASGLQIFNPVAGVAGNLLQLSVNTLLPPVMPFASAWNNLAVPRLLQMPCVPWIHHNFPRLDLTIREVASEENIGIGLGVAALWLALLARKIVSVTGKPPVRSRFCGWPALGLPFFTLVAGLLSCGVFLAKMGSEAGPRIFAPYYAILLVAILRLVGSDHPRLRSAWLGLCLVAQSVPVLLLLVEPTRNLLPVPQIAHSVIRSRNGLLTRIEAVYSAYQSRADALAPLRSLIPATVVTVGFIADADKPEISLWRPFGRKRVVDVVDLERRESLPDYCVALESWIQHSKQMRLGEWAHAMKLREVGRRNVPMRAHGEPEVWAVLTKTNPPASDTEAAASAVLRCQNTVLRCQNTVLRCQNTVLRCQLSEPGSRKASCEPERGTDGKSGSGWVAKPSSCLQ